MVEKTITITYLSLNRTKAKVMATYALYLYTNYLARKTAYSFITLAVVVMRCSGLIRPHQCGITTQIVWLPAAELKVAQFPLS